MVPSFDRVRHTFAAEDLDIKGLIRTRLARVAAKGRECPPNRVPRHMQLAATALQAYEPESTVL